MLGIIIRTHGLSKISDTINLKCTGVSEIILSYARSESSWAIVRLKFRRKRLNKGYNLTVMRQSACLDFNPIMVDNYAAFFNCAPVSV